MPHPPPRQNVKLHRNQILKNRAGHDQRKAADTDRIGELVPEENALLQTDDSRGDVDGEEENGVAVTDDVVAHCVEGSLEGTVKRTCLS